VSANRIFCTIPAEATKISPLVTEILCIGGGGGGSSGQLAAAGTACGGGGGGAGGFWQFVSVPTSLLASTESVMVGTGGQGGAAVTSAGVGKVGTAGGASWYGASSTTAICMASGGNPGLANVAGTGGVGGANNRWSGQ